MRARRRKQTRRVSFTRGEAHDSFFLTVPSDLSFSVLSREATRKAEASKGREEEEGNVTSPDAARRSYKVLEEYQVPERDSSTSERISCAFERPRISSFDLISPLDNRAMENADETSIAAI